MNSKITIIDCHAHLGGLDSIPNLNSICDYAGLGRMNIVCTISRESVNANPTAFVATAEFPERFYVFAGLDHSSHFTSGKIATPSLAEQVDRLIALGADGVKLIETKPTTRKIFDVPVDSAYFKDFFACLEETGFPVLWHVADPEEFWDPGKTPSWAKERGWGYDDTFIEKEQLYTEVGNVLQRHPRLKIIFAHFYFLSADLSRATALFDRFEGVHLDLAPGIELLYNMSKDVSRTRDFFEKYSHRILFGTDIFSGQPLDEARIRAGIVTRWLETDDEYRIPEDADFLLGPPEDGLMKGLSLSVETLSKIYHGNFERLVGPKPKRLNSELAARECDRIAREISILKGENAENTYATAAAERLRQTL